MSVYSIRLDNHHNKRAKIIIFLIAFLLFCNIHFINYNRIIQFDHLVMLDKMLGNKYSPLQIVQKEYSGELPIRSIHHLCTHSAISLEQ